MTAVPGTHPPRGDAGDWEGIIDILIQEHGYLLSLLDALEKEAQQLERGKIPDFPLLRDMIDYLVRFPGEYHHPREELIYADLHHTEPSFAPLYERLEREHLALSEAHNTLLEQLTNICEGRPAERKALRKSLLKYIKEYRQHIKFETREVLPRARFALSPAQLQRIEAKTRYKDDPLFSNRIKQEYRRLQSAMSARIDKLETQVAGYQMSFLERSFDAISDAVDNLKELPLLPGLPRPAHLCRSPSWQARFLNASTRTFMKPLMRFGSIHSMREMNARMDQRQEVPEDVRWREVSGQGYEGEWIHIHPKRPRKILLYFPGGAFVMRSVAQHRSFVSRICREANCKALVVHYRLAPETPFPGGLQDCLAAYHSLLDQGIDPQNITLAGDSAGGGLVLSTLLALRDEGSPMPATAVLISPLGDLTYSGKSREYNKRKDPILPTHRASSMHELYIGDALPEDRYLSPVLADFNGLPPLLGQVGSTEILLDDTVRAAARAEEAEVPFFLEIWREMPHDFPLFDFLPEARLATRRIAEFINTAQLDPLPRTYGRCTPAG